MLRTWMTGGLVALIALAAACSDLPGTDGGDADNRWDDVAASLEPGLVEDSSNPCQAGSAECLDILIAEMERRAEPLADQCDHDVLFATMYLRMTEQVQGALEDDRFEDPAASVHITAWFASYYFEAYDAWHDGDRDAVPAAWRLAFDAADERSVRGMGNLLLGMNAHVSRDLPYVVADVLGEPLDAVDPDYALVNELIENLSTGIIEEVGERFDPSIRPARLPLTMGGAETFGALVTAWRTESWNKGMDLLAADSEEARERVSNRIEFDAEARALALLPEVSYLPVVESPERRDAHCEDAGR